MFSTYLSVCDIFFSQVHGRKATLFGELLHNGSGMDIGFVHSAD